MNLHHKVVAVLFMLFFVSSSLHSPAIAVPSSRCLKSVADEDLCDDFQRSGRMDLEIADYAGTGANNHHDPKSPPTS